MAIILPKYVSNSFIINLFKIMLYIKFIKSISIFIAIFFDETLFLTTKYTDNDYNGRFLFFLQNTRELILNKYSKAILVVIFF